MDSLLFLFFLAFINSFLIWFVFRNARLVILNILLMLVTPWVWTLILNAPTLWEFSQVTSQNLSILENIAQILSWDYLFFNGSPKLFYAVGEHGYFLISFLALFIFGLWTLLTSGGRKQIWLTILLLTGIVVAIFSLPVIGFLSVFWFLPILSVIGAIGFYRLFSLLGSKNTTTFMKVLILVNVSWILYEALRFFRVIQVQSTLQL